MAAQLSTNDRQLLLGQPINGNGSLAQLISEGKYDEVLGSPAAQAIFGTGRDEDIAVKDLASFITTQAHDFICTEGSEQGWRQLALVAIACLQAYMQTNWTGPTFVMDPAAVLPKPLAGKWQESYIDAVAQPLEEGMDKHEIGRREQSGRIYLGAKQSVERAQADQKLLQMLEVDGEEAYPLAPRPMYLYFARLLLIDIFGHSNDLVLAERDEAVPAAHWWCARVLITQQSLLDSKSQTLLDQILDHFKLAQKHLPQYPATAKCNVTTTEPATAMVPDIVDDDFEQPRKEAMTDGDGEDPTMVTSEDFAPADNDRWESVPAADRDLWTRHFIEVGVVYSNHQMAADAKRYFSWAQAASGLEWELTGAKGKRTKFQIRDLTQLVLLAKSLKHNASSSKDANNDDEVPESMELNDDTLLDGVKYSDQSVADHASQEKLRVIDECIILAFCLNVKNEDPAQGLTSEIMLPFVARVLQQPSNWSVYTMGLLLRSRLETGKTRTIERATLQMQALVDQINRPLPNTQEANGAERLRYLFALSLPSQWEMERELADLFKGLGVVRSALDIYERLSMWEDVVSCYVVLDRKDVAERVVREQLEQTPDRPKLWCLMGEIKADPEHWRHAWEVSGKRYARAMRSLGAYHFGRGEFKESLECYEKALQLNPLFEKSWYIMGCSALKVKEWKRASVAFQRVVSLDHRNGEAWNNLANAYMHMGSDYVERGWYALREAVKGKFDSWQIWANLLSASLALGQFSSAILAMQRIIELRVDKERDRCVDLDALKTIISSITRGFASEGLSERDAEYKKDKLKRGMEHLLVDVIEAKISNSAPLWRAMADYWFWAGDYRHCLSCYIKAARCLSQSSEIVRDESLFSAAVDATLDLVMMYENLGDKLVTIRMPVATGSFESNNDHELPEKPDNEERKALAVSEPVCADWKYQSKMVIERLRGKGGLAFKDTSSYQRLVEALDDLKKQK